MKKNKLPIVFLALACAVMIWLYDVTVVNPNDTTTFSGITVHLEHEEELRANGLMVTEGDTLSVTLKISGRRSELKKLTRSNIQVSADLSEVSKEGTHELPYTVSFPANVTPGDLMIESRMPASVTVAVERFLSRPVEVRPVFIGESTEDDSLIIDSDAMTVSSTELSVTGPSAILETIDYARVVIDKTNITETTTLELDYELLDVEGETIPKDELVIDCDKVSVTIPVLKYKEVPLALKPIPGGGATEKNITYSLQPATIKISGDVASVDSIEQIELGTLDFAKVIESGTRVYPILMPDNINNVSGITEVEASVTITGLEITTLTIPVSEIELVNIPEGLKAEAVGENIQLTLRGTPAALQNLTPEELHVSADLAAFRAGTFVVSVTVVPSEGLQVGATGSSNSLTVTLS